MSFVSEKLPALVKAWKRQLELTTDPLEAAKLEARITVAEVKDKWLLNYSDHKHQMANFALIAEASNEGAVMGLDEFMGS